MTRRSTIGGLLAGFLGALGFARNQEDPVYTTYGREGQPIDVDSLKAALGFPVEEIEGSKAFARWQELRAKGNGYPVIVGDAEQLAQLVEQASFKSDDDPAAIIAKAAEYTFPDDLLAARQKDLEDYLKAYPDSGTLEEFQPNVGEWPSVAPESPELTVHADVLSQKPYARCFLVIFPTDKSYEVPAYAKWGGWNANPMPEVHVAALKSWEERYGAQLVGMDAAVLNLKLERRPTTREEAMAVAREQYAYCEDIVLQGVDSLSNLAASNLESDWWYFWWD